MFLQSGVSMATISNPQLTITTDPMQNGASLVARCDVDLTDFELNAMRLLGLRYTLACGVLNRDLQYEQTVLVYEPQFVPADLPVAHMAFEAVSAMSDLHQHIFTRDELVAEFTLTNDETGSREIVRSELVTADLRPEGARRPIQRS
jgi:hypothetical protein